ncbi:glycosyltransferase family 4 protein [Granulicatella seriolae]|uniref:Glycosyltransferase family 4 protein n=1 Tax=Granulicatella seriolae TaxID=2967226 RepID=A0ABT1WPQ4_9LACT|nr:glycosyltransferase family 4 protein [Granulicatella seriolae]
MNKILVYCQYYYPEQFRIHDICEELVRRGYEVTVVTGIPNYPIGSFFEGYGLFNRRREMINGVQVVRLPIVPRGKRTIQLMFNYFSYIVSAGIYSLFTRQKASHVFTYGLSPITQALPGIIYSKRKKVKNILYVLDLWPESVTATTSLENRRIISFIERMVSYIYRHYQYILVTSGGFLESVNKYNQNADNHVAIWPQYAEETYYPVPKTKPEIFTILFAGNIGVAQNMHLYPKVAKLLKERGYMFQFKIIGDGRAKQSLEQQVETERVSEYFEILPPVPVDQVKYEMAKVDVAIISLNDDPMVGKTIPGKLQSCMACGMPLLVSANGEVAEIVEKSNAGLVSNADDAEALAENIVKFLQLTREELEILGKNSYEYYQNNYDKAKLLDQLEEYLNR